MAHGELDKARIVAEAVDQIGREILSLAPSQRRRTSCMSSTIPTRL